MRLIPVNRQVWLIERGEAITPNKWLPASAVQPLSQLSHFCTAESRWEAATSVRTGGRVKTRRFGLFAGTAEYSKGLGPTRTLHHIFTESPGLTHWHYVAASTDPLAFWMFQGEEAEGSGRASDIKKDGGHPSLLKSDGRARTEVVMGGLKSGNGSV